MHRVADRRSVLDAGHGGPRAERRAVVQGDQALAQRLAGFDAARHDDELADVAGWQLLVEAQVVARCAGADVGNVVLELVVFCLVLVEPGFQFACFGVDGGDRRTLRQAQFDIQLKAGRIREELLLHLAHADDGQHEQDQRDADDQPAPAHAPADQLPEANVEGGAVDVVVFRMARAVHADLVDQPGEARRFPGQGAGCPDCPRIGQQLVAQPGNGDDGGQP